MRVELIERLKKKDEKAFNELYYAYKKKIKYEIYEIVRDDELANDLTQEVFSKMYQKIHTLKDSRLFHSWFIKLAKNHVYDYLKKVKTFVLNENIVNNQGELEVTKQITDKFYFLSDLELKIVIERRIMNESFSNIAQSIGYSTSKTKTMYYEIIKKIRRIYD